MGYTSNLSFVRKNPATTAVATVALIAGVAFAFRGGSATNNYVDCKTETITCTATGGLAKYAYCNWQEPTDDAGSGSTLTNLYYTVGPSPVVVGVDFTVGSSATLSGATAIHANVTNFSTASGTTVLYSTGATKVFSGNYLRAVTLTDPGGGHRGSMTIDYCTRLSRR